MLSHINLANASSLNDSQKEPIFVEYMTKGEIHTIAGKKTTQGYQFNSQSKKVLNLATLSWPPYISEQECDKGWVFNFTAALLVSKGYQVNIHFYPWARSKMLVEQGKVDILFPEYAPEKAVFSDVSIEENNADLLTLTDSFPGGDVSLATHKDNPVTYTGDLSILHNKVVGVVRGYINTKEIDAMIREDKFSAVEAVNELQLVKLLVEKRVDFIVGDSKVFTHAVKLSGLPLKHQQRLLENINYIKPEVTRHAFVYSLSKKRPEHKRLFSDINSALSAFKQSGLTKQFIQAKTQCYSKNTTKVDIKVRLKS
jgi:polar amino acid transport system substrate-binding protein